MGIRRRRALAAVPGAVLLAQLFGGGVAAAHVTAHVHGEQPERGGHGTLVLRVPNEDAVATTSLEVEVPPEHGITTARTRPVPGWVPGIRRAAGGVVTGVTWTARPGAELPGGDLHYQDFELTLGPLPQDVATLVLPAAQGHADGTVTRWDERPAPGTEARRPAPTVALAAPSPGGPAHHAMAPAARGGHGVPWLAGGSLLVLGAAAGAGVVLVRRGKVRT
ncbi:uncharacterized protein YcnI [Crossiella equi]|uniref:Uncharacterized protein YcnI n=1 Tax=Crossiella equi TaxID=130796 RepID=A0ABS5APP8_9PSEU|nr:YcnI family protein [Crossiella equi]MBP2478543.1 uncharacterized protein YcnI [Crossiella equi]